MICSPGAPSPQGLWILGVNKTAAEGLKIRQKHEDLIAYFYLALRQFPKSEKFTMAARIKNQLIVMLELMVKANKAKRKLPVLLELDTELEVLRTLVRLSMQLKFLAMKKYEFAAVFADEIASGDIALSVPLAEMVTLGILAEGDVGFVEPDEVERAESAP